MHVVYARNRSKPRPDGTRYESTVARLHVPSHIASQIHPETEFEPELTKEGILYRVVCAPPQSNRRPVWLTKGKQPTTKEI